jgi:hypothetical protein
MDCGAPELRRGELRKSRGYEVTTTAKGVFGKSKCLATSDGEGTNGVALWRFVAVGREGWPEDVRPGGCDWFCYQAQHRPFNRGKLLFGHEHRLLAAHVQLLAPLGATARINHLSAVESKFLTMMLLAALPFIWIGVTMTVRRLRDAGKPVWLATLFFVPF